MVASLTHTDSHYTQIIEALRPQGRLALIDEGVLKTTLNETFGTINAANLRRAHALVESNRSRGKVVLAGF